MAGQFNWNAAMDEDLYDIYVQRRRFMGETEHTNWRELANMFSARTGHALPPMVFKNRFDHNRKKWRMYDNMRQRGIQFTWDQQTGKLVADEQWWANATQDLARKVRRLDLEREQIVTWEAVYTDIYMQFPPPPAHPVNANYESE